MKAIEYPNLEALFRPKSIAIVGATEDPRRSAGLPLKYALDHGYQGKLYPVNKGRETVLGLKCYPTVLDIPGEVDAAMVVVPSAAVPAVVEECAKKGIKGVVIGVSGFAELDEEGRQREERIVEIAQKSGMRICGPNTNGLLNVHEHISLGYSYAQEVVLPGRLGYVTQSGALLSATVPRFSERGVGMSYFVGAGNQADLEVMDYVRYLLDDPNTDVIAIHVEGFKDPMKFLDVAGLARRRKKPIVMLKVGRSEFAARAVQSHTGSLAGSDQVVDAICKQQGITRVDDFDELIAVSSVFLKCRPPRGNRIGIISSSGGAIGMVADRAAGLDLTFPDVSKKTKDEASIILPWYKEFRNPFDIATAGSMATQDLDLARQAVRFMLNDEQIDALVAIITPMDRRGTQNYLRAIVDASKVAEKPILLFSPMGGFRSEEAEIFREGNIPMVMDSAECVKGLTALIAFDAMVERMHKEDYGLSLTLKTDEIRRLVKMYNRKLLGEHESKEILACCGIPVTKERLANSVEEATQYAGKIGYPVVLKVNSPDIAHKTEAGGVRTDISDHVALMEAYRDIMFKVKVYNPGARINGILVQEQIMGGREVIIGMSKDPQFGPTITFGIGGILVEVLQDVSLRVAPLSRVDAIDMINEVKGRRILAAFRGIPEADIEGIADALLKLSELAIDLRDMILEIDINPLIVGNRGEGVKAADALIVLQ